MCFGVAAGQVPTGPINSTAYGTKVALFICPSDPNAQSVVGIDPVGPCNYSCSFGTTTTPSTVQVMTGSTGLFTWWRSYRIQNCTDGTSNTIAFAETPVGDGSTANFSASSGIIGIALGPAEVFDASANWPAVQAGLQLCNAAYNSRSTANLGNGGGARWMKGSAADTLFNTVVTPNSQVYPWSWCTDEGGTNEIEISKASSSHPGGVNALFADGSVHFVKDSINQATWWRLAPRPMARSSARTATKEPVGKRCGQARST